MVSQRIYSPRPHCSGTHTYLAEVKGIEPLAFTLALLSKQICALRANFHFFIISIKN